MWKQTESSSKDVNPQDGEGWLVNDQQGLVCEFSADDPSIQDSWITIRTFRWRKPDYPIPQSRRRLLSDGAIEEWKRMQAAGWRRCLPPVRWLTHLLNSQIYVWLSTRKESSRQGSTAREPIKLMTWTKLTSLPEGRSSKLKVNPMPHNSPDMNLLSADVFCAH